MKTVLVVEDETVLRSLLVEEISDMGHRCAAAEHGARALERLEALKPDLIVTDGAMPVLDGPGLITRVREKHSAKTLPIIVISALTAAADKERAMAAGANAYVRKPVDFDELTAMMNDLLNRSASA